MSAEKALRALNKVILDEVKTNPEFGKKVLAALDRTMADLPPARKKRPEPPFNPVNVMRNDGASVLRSRLRELTSAELKNMIGAYGLDRREKPKSSSKKADVVSFVVRQSQAAVKKENLF